MIDNENYEDDEELLQNKVSQLEDKLKEIIFISNNNKELLFHLKNELIEKDKKITKITNTYMNCYWRKRRCSIRYKSLEKTFKRVETENIFLNKKIAFIERDLAKVKKENSKLKSSTSWKITKPLRLVSKKLKN
jgi:chromosome segregation ATPase